MEISNVLVFSVTNVLTPCLTFVSSAPTEVVLEASAQGWPGWCGVGSVVGLTLDSAVSGGWNVFRRFNPLCRGTFSQGCCLSLQGNKTPSFYVSFRIFFLFFFSYTPRGYRIKGCPLSGTGKQIKDNIVSNKL